MATVVIAMAGAVGVSPAPNAGTAQAASPTGSLGAYRGAANPGGIAGFGSWIPSSVPYALDFFSGESWSTIESPTWWLNAWKGKGYQMVYGVPIIPATGGSLAAGASGAYNSHYLKLAQTLVAYGQGNVILRPGWEFGGGWDPWAVKTTTDAANFAEYFRQIVTTMRSVAPGIRFDWNPIWGDQPVNPELSYPGNAYVDYIGVDVYDNSWIANYKDPVARWNDFMTHKWGATWHRAFAAAHGKPMSFPEWGLVTRDDGHGGGDAPYFIEQMYKWISQNNVAYQIYFEYDASDGKHRLMNGQFPKSAAKFQELFGNQAPPPPDTTPPTVASTTPAAGASGVSVDASATVTFSEPMSAATISGSTLKLVKAPSKSVAATVTYDSAKNAATIDPTSPLDASSTYTVTVTGGGSGVKDAAGNPLVANYSWSFTTAAPPPPDKTAPTVTSTTPAAGATGVSLDASATATFSEHMSAATISGSTLKLVRAPSTSVAATVTYDSSTNTATIDPASPLEKGTTYTATVMGGSSGAKDLAGNPLAGNVSWSFTTTTATPPANAYLSDLGWISATSGWGPVENDRSNGENAGGDGKTIKLDGTSYAKGFGLHAQSEIVYDLKGSPWKRFSAAIGVDDEVGARGSVVFQVFVDGAKVYDSGTMTGSSATKNVSVSIAGKSQLKLVVTSPDNINYDHADWADAQVFS